MKNRLWHLIVSIGLLTAVVAFSGCTKNAVTRTVASPLSIQRLLSNNTHITEVKAYQDNGELVIYGKVKRTAEQCCDAVTGHIDIVVLDPAGRVADVVSTLFSPRNIPKVRSRSSRFSARLPFTEDELSGIILTYHNSLDGVDSAAYKGALFVCRHNQAIPEEPVLSALQVKATSSGSLTVSKPLVDSGRRFSTAVDRANN